MDGTFMDASPYCSNIYSLTNPTGSASRYRLRLKLRCENWGAAQLLNVKK